MTGVSKILHASFIVADTRRALDFYQQLLGLEVDTHRPELGYPGVWLHIGDGQIHLLELPNPDPITGRPAHGGRDRHLAMQVDSISDLKQKLDTANIPCTVSKSGRKALFCRDPDGNALEFIELT